MQNPYQVREQKLLTGKNYYAIKLASIDNPYRMGEKIWLSVMKYSHPPPHPPSIIKFINITASVCELWHFGGHQPTRGLKQPNHRNKTFLNIT